MNAALPLHRTTPAWVPFASIVVAATALMLRGDHFVSNAVLVLVGVVGLVLPLASARTRVHAPTWAAVTLAGLVVFAIGRALGPAYAERLTVVGIGVVVLAGIAEEALFRRGLYGLVAARSGDVAAIAVSALAFAIIHVPTYGWESVPLNLAAGCIFGWQRWASRSWTAPAATHALANLFQAGWI